ncbi:hypothetical protein IWQ62_002661 [Dispira parvispora]|uniref:LDB19 N-terminal domain-containing protein n=1 Tax=Dispira parvispora TaxID=1520584 RepID=A0A9W8AQV2_9FUNG|nr:hypothetical protein IWQ62_002661 [Dispira parvispora]
MPTMRILPNANLFESGQMRLDVHLFQDSVIFRGLPENSPGSVLAGYVHLHVTEATRLRALILYFKGVERLQATTVRNSINIQRDIIFHTWHFLPLGHENHFVTKGTHSFPFEMALPGHLPETIQTENARISYSLTAVAIRPTFRKDFVVTKPVVVQRYALPDLPHLTEPLVTEGNLGSHIRYQLQVGEKRVGLGEKLSLHTSLKYLSNVYVSKVWITLMEYSTVTDKYMKSPSEITPTSFLPNSPFQSNQGTPSTLITPANTVSDDMELQRGSSNSNNQHRTFSSVKVVHEVVDDSFCKTDTRAKNLTRLYHFTIPTEKLHCDVNTETVRVHHRVRMVFQTRRPLNIEGHIALSFSIRLLPCTVTDVTAPPPKYHLSNLIDIDSCGKLDGVATGDESNKCLPGYSFSDIDYAQCDVKAH